MTLLFAVVLLAIAAELIGRFVFGLGNPPQAVRDDDMEYRLKPSSEYHRLGNYIKQNRYSMRSDDFPETKQQPDELRVMILGDSIINAGSHIDQSELATELLRDQLGSELGRPVVVGNIAASSWGPPNLLGYVKKFGLYDADVVLVVVNSSDAWDVPVPMADRVQSHVPSFALEEVAMELWERFGTSAESAKEQKQTPENAALVLSSLEQLVAIARVQGVAIGIVLHYRQSELNTPPSEGLRLFQKFADDRGIAIFSTEQSYIAAMQRSNIYNDNMHLNAQGEQALAEVLLSATVELLSQETSEP